MHPADGIEHDLPAELSDAERRELAATGVRLQAERPLPNPNFRGELRRGLLGASAASRRPSMGLGTVRALSASYACFGIVLLAIAAAGVAGTGPFSA